MSKPLRFNTFDDDEEISMTNKATADLLKRGSQRKKDKNRSSTGDIAH